MALPPDDRLHAIVREILAQEKYARWRPQDLGGSWVARLARELEDLRRWFATLAAESPVLFACLLAGLGLVAAALLFHVVWTIRRSLRAQPAGPPRAPAGPAPAETAARLAGAGRFLDAARLLQMAVLEDLVARRVVTLSPAESNAVLAARLRAAPLPREVAERAIDLVRRLERRWFGDRVEDEALYDAWTHLRGELATEPP